MRCNCEFDLKEIIWQCPLESISGEDYCYWHKIEDEKNLTKEELEELKILYDKNVFGVYLKNAFLKNANLKKANIIEANLEGSNLYKANLEGANLSNSNLKGANLEGANLKGANLEGANLKGANLSYSNFEQANLENANFKNCNLVGTNFSFGSTGDYFELKNNLSIKLSPKYIGIIVFPSKKFASEYDIIKSGLSLKILENEPDILDNLWDYKIRTIVNKFNEKSTPKNRLDCHIFEVPNENLSVLVTIADSHPEPIFDLINLIEQQILIEQWCIGSTIGDDCDSFEKYNYMSLIQLGKEKSCHHTNSRVGDYFDDKYLRIKILGKWTLAIFYKDSQFLQLYNPGTYDVSPWEDFQDYYESKSFKLEFLESCIPPKESIKVTKSPYDPILSQFNEIKNSTRSYIATLTQDIEKRNQLLSDQSNFSQFNVKLPVSTDFITKKVFEQKRILDESSKLLNSFETMENNHNEKISVFLNIMDSVANDFDNSMNYLNIFSNIIDNRESVHKSNSFRDLKTHMLATAQQVGNDLLLRANIKSQMAVTSGKELSIQSLTNLLDNVDYRISDQQSMFGITLPNNFIMRLGSFPLMSHLVAHILVDNLIEKEILVSIAERFETIIRSKQTSLYQKLNFGSEILAHAVAVFLVGPAYIWSLARFVQGNLGDIIDKNNLILEKYENLPMDIALRICIGIAGKKFENFHFESPLIGQLTPICDDELYELAKQLVYKPYGSNEHCNQMPKIQNALIDGFVIKEIDSILILNSLWDAVIHKKGYLNEISAVLSISDRSDHIYIKNNDLSANLNNTFFNEAIFNEKSLKTILATHNWNDAEFDDITQKILEDMNENL